MSNGLTLPFAGSVSSSGPAFEITNTGAGAGVHGVCVNVGPGNPGAGVKGENQDNGTGVDGSSVNGTGVRGTNSNQSVGFSFGVFGGTPGGIGVGGRTEKFIGVHGVCECGPRQSRNRSE